MLNTSPFFIVGVGRSGTTLLRLMMNSHPEIAIPYESHFITDYQMRLNQFGDLSDKGNLRALVDQILAEELLSTWDHHFDSTRIIEQINEPIDLASIFNAIYTDYARAKGKSRWGDKSDYLDRMHLINKVFPDARFIHIIRDGRDVANSVLKLDWGPNDIVQAAEWWHEHVHHARILGSVLGTQRYAEVRYEDLVAAPETELRRLCDFIDADYSSDMLDYHQNRSTLIPDSRRSQHQNTDSPPDISRCYAWKRSMKIADQALFNQQAHQTLEDMGYEVPQLPVNGTWLKLRKAGVMLKRQIG